MGFFVVFLLGFFFQNRNRLLNKQSLGTKKENIKILSMVFNLHFTVTRSEKLYLDLV